MPDLVDQAEERAERLRRQARRQIAPAPVQRRRGRLFLATGAFALLGYFALFILVRSNRSAEADLAATIRIQRNGHPALRRIMTAVSWFGFRPQSLLLPAIAVASTWFLRFRLETVFLIAAWGASFLSFVTKLFVRRPRPENPLVRVVAANIRDTSFPSGHTLHYTAFWGFVSYLLFTRARNRAARWISIGVITPLIALVGPSRIYLGHHWLTDVLASYLLGIAYLLGLVSVYERVKAWGGERDGDRTDRWDSEGDA